MAAEFDATEFIDRDFHAATKAAYAGAANATGAGTRAPSREEVDSKVGEAQQKLADLKRAQEQLERERSALEETRRRQIEFQNGRQETIRDLTRGVGLLEEAEFAARRDSEQMARCLADMKQALAKVEATSEQGWTRDNFGAELTRALTVIENARMEWNSARLKFSILSGVKTGEVEATKAAAPSAGLELTGMGFWRLCRIGLALTWPLLLAAVAAACVFSALLMGRR